MEHDDGRQLEREFALFYGSLKDLRRSVRETQQYFRDLNSSNGFSPEGKMTDGEGAELDALTKCSQVIMVIGKSSYAKAMVVNKLLRQKLLPCLTCFDEPTVKWRDVRIRYHHFEQPRCHLTLPNHFEIVDVESGSSVVDVVRMSDLVISGSDEARNEATLDVKVRNNLLIYQTEIRVLRSWTDGQAAIDSFQRNLLGTLPVVIYALAGKLLQPEEIAVLNELKAAIGSEPSILFVSVPILPDAVREHNHLQDSGCELSDASYNAAVDPVALPQLINGSANGHATAGSNTSGTVAGSLTLFQQLVDCGFLSIMPLQPDACQTESDFVDNFDLLTKSVTVFSRRVLQCHLARTVSLLNVVQRRCMQMFITLAYDLSRYLQITPKRMEFVKEKEVELYATLSDMATYKQNELQRIIVETKDSLTPGLLQKAEDYAFLSVEVPPSGVLTNPRQLHSCVREMQDLVLGNLSVAIESQLLNSVNVLRDSYMGVLQRCLEHLEDVDHGADLGSTSQALKEILTAAYQIEVTVRGGTSWKTQLVNKIKQVISSVLPKVSERVDAEWRRNLALSMMNSLSDHKLAKSICSQIKERLSVAHSTFLTSMKRLAEQHVTRQERTEEQQLRVRKIFTPKIARLTLESTSLKDYILYGMPSYTREIGRGQYGVVYECQQWANYGPCAVKIVLPPDEKHWNDLAMEFCYTKNLPEHERIVSLRGSVIDRAFGSHRCETAVLLIMDRHLKDLYVAIKCGLDTVSRLRVSIDVIEGIRFLHGQGLVHRDVKLKNVLLDENNRGKITDLGFCKPEAMMSGSIVGTPIHMAPELFNGTGKYDGSVDMYAFGILFWYVCAGHVKLPSNYERCSSKERLWQDVEKGLRPERLPKFDADCWDVMEQCWQADPQRRPWPGDVEPKIQYILSRHAEFSGLRRHRERSIPSPFDFDRTPSPTPLTD